jgi:uncharacterized membrane protein
MDLQPLLESSFAVRLHVATVVPAFLLGAWQLLASRKGSPSHRVIGTVYLGLMVVTAVSAFFIPSFSSYSLGAGRIRVGFIHLFIPLTFFGVWGTWRALKSGDVAAHRASMRGLYLGGLIIAGLLAFTPGRIMHRMFFG